ncbi:MAG TPA: DUF6174 domain-containing protein [Pirellulales bacterium]|jgi:hypothetical protein
MSSRRDGKSLPSDVTNVTQTRRLGVRSIFLGFAGGSVLALAVLLGVLIARREPSVPMVTREELAAAERLWQTHGPASYTMDLLIGGRQPGPVHIEVSDGTVTRMTRDGVTPSQRRTWEYWTVPEQFETIRQDFDSAETAGGFGAAPGTQTILKADFDPQYGYPRRYQRFVLASKTPAQSPSLAPIESSAGADLDVDWRVTRFEAGK